MDYCSPICSIFTVVEVCRWRFVYSFDRENSYILDTVCTAVRTWKQGWIVIVIFYCKQQYSQLDDALQENVSSKKHSMSQSPDGVQLLLSQKWNVQRSAESSVVSITHVVVNLWLTAV